MLFGLKSEKLKIEDIDLENTVVISSGEAADPQEFPCMPEKEKRPRGAMPGHVGNGRKIPSDLPVIEVVLEVPAEDLMCKKCGLPATDKPLMDSVSYQVSVAKRYILKKLIRKAYGKACECDEQPTIIMALPAAQIIPKGKYSEEIWTDILTRTLDARPRGSLCGSPAPAVRLHHSETAPDIFPFQPRDFAKTAKSIYFFSF